MARTSHVPPKGKKYRSKSDIIYELHNLPGKFYDFQLMSLSPEIYSLQEVQDKAIENDVEIFEDKKK